MLSYSELYVERETLVDSDTTVLSLSLKLKDSDAEILELSSSTTALFPVSSSSKSRTKSSISSSCESLLVEFDSLFMLLSEFCSDEVELSLCVFAKLSPRVCDVDELADSLSAKLCELDSIAAESFWLAVSEVA